MSARRIRLRASWAARMKYALGATPVKIASLVLALLLTAGAAVWQYPWLESKFFEVTGLQTSEQVEEAEALAVAHAKLATMLDRVQLLEAPNNPSEPVQTAWERLQLYKTEGAKLSRSSSEKASKVTRMAQGVQIAYDDYLVQLELQARLEAEKKAASEAAAAEAARQAAASAAAEAARIAAEQASEDSGSESSSSSPGNEWSGNTGGNTGGNNGGSTGGNSGGSNTFFGTCTDANGNTTSQTFSSAAARDAWIAACLA